MTHGQTPARPRDPQHRPRDAAGEHGGHCRREQATEPTGGCESKPERPTLGAHRARRAQEHDGVAAASARLGRIQVVVSVDRDPTDGPVGKKQSRLLHRKHGETLVLGREKAAKLSGRWMQILVCQEGDLSLEAIECGLLKRPSREIRADEQRKGNGGENSGADGEPQTRLERDQASRETGPSRMR